MVDMSVYLETKVADYTATTLSISPHDMLVEEGQKRQYFHEFDSGDLDVVTTSGSFFTVQLQWDFLNNADAAAILDLYHNTAKANGKKKTFYWLHPVDGNTYVVRFNSDLSQIETADRLSKSTEQITFKIEGVKA